MPPSAFAIPVSKTKTHKFISKTPAAIPIPGSQIQFDVSPYFRALGVTSPPGSLAVYNASTSQLLICNSQENITLARALISMGHPLRLPLMIQFSVVEYIPKNGSKTFRDSMAVSEFFKQNKKVKTLCEADCSSFMESPTYLSYTTGNGGSEDVKKPFDRNTSGFKAFILTSFANMTGGIDFDLQFRFRSNPALANGKSANATMRTDINLWAHHPLVIYTGDLPAAKGKTKPHKFAIIVNVGFVNAAGWKTDSAGKLVS